MRSLPKAPTHDQCRKSNPRPLYLWSSALPTGPWDLMNHATSSRNYFRLIVGFLRNLEKTWKTLMKCTWIFCKNRHILWHVLENLLWEYFIIIKKALKCNCRNMTASWEAEAIPRNSVVKIWKSITLLLLSHSVLLLSLVNLFLSLKK